MKSSEGCDWSNCRWQHHSQKKHSPRCIWKEFQDENSETYAWSVCSYQITQQHCEFRAQSEENEKPSDDGKVAGRNWRSQMTTEKVSKKTAAEELLKPPIHGIGEIVKEERRWWHPQVVQGWDVLLASCSLWTVHGWGQNKEARACTFCVRRFKGTIMLCSACIV